MIPKSASDPLPPCARVVASSSHLLRCARRAHHFHLHHRPFPSILPHSALLLPQPWFLSYAFELSRVNPVVDYLNPNQLVKLCRRWSRCNRFIIWSDGWKFIYFYLWQINTNRNEHHEPQDMHGFAPIDYASGCNTQDRASSGATCRLFKGGGLAIDSSYF